MVIPKLDCDLNFMLLPENKWFLSTHQDQGVYLCQINMLKLFIKN